MLSKCINFKEINKKAQRIFEKGGMSYRFYSYPLFYRFMNFSHFSAFGKTEQTGQAI